MKCRRFGIVPDDNFPKSKVTILVKPNSRCPDTGHAFIRDGVVCTGIMVRLTDKHPLELDYWWAQSPEYVWERNLLQEKVDPEQNPNCASERKLRWKKLNNVTLGILEFVLEWSTRSRLTTHS
mmetsp:Transcript_3407/g.6201  ORF Transcript_3407/g.6201 Transcript_3407/m.6201 type:complete len:123 (+) Transcript_3407:759-1127(+)